MAHGGFRIAWDSSDDASSFANVIQLTEIVCTPFALRQFQLLGLLPPVDTHPRVLDNASGSGRQAEILREAYSDGGKAIDITCCDLSPAMINGVQQRIDKGNWDNVKAHVVDAQVNKSETKLI
jgi:SAM-dependent methyltransferase